MTPLHHGAYVHLDVLPNGDLRITLTKEGVAELNDIEFQHPKRGDDEIFFQLYDENDAMSAPHKNSGPLFMHDIQYLDGGHLSNAPCIVTEWDLPDDEDGFRRKDVPDFVQYVTSEHSKIWYWNEYMLISILQHIKRHGESVFTRL